MVRSLVALIFFAPLLLKAQSQYAEQLRAGNSAYTDSNYTQAEEAYRKSAADDPSSAKAAFNLGDALYRQERYEEAIEAFEKSYGKQSDPQQQSKSLQNLGNAHYQLKNYPEAAKAYGESLKLDPENEEARYNMAQAIRRIQEPPLNKSSKKKKSRRRRKRKRTSKNNSNLSRKKKRTSRPKSRNSRLGRKKSPRQILRKIRSRKAVRSIKRKPCDCLKPWKNKRKNCRRS